MADFVVSFDRSNLENVTRWLEALVVSGHLPGAVRLEAPETDTVAEITTAAATKATAQAGSYKRF
jgi:hypothetical protein